MNKLTARITVLGTQPATVAIAETSVWTLSDGDAQAFADQIRIEHAVSDGGTIDIMIGNDIDAAFFVTGGAVERDNKGSGFRLPPDAIIIVG